MAVEPDGVAVLADDERGLGVGLQAHEAVDHMGTRLLECAGPSDVRLLVEPGGHLDQDGHLLAALGGPHQGGDDRAVAGRSVEALLDGEDVGVLRRLVQQLLDRRREGVVGMVDEDVLAVEDAEDGRPLVALHRREGGRHERRPRAVVEIGPVEPVDGPQAVETEGAGEPVDVVGTEPELLGEPLDRCLRGPGVDLEADHRQEPAAAQLLLEGEEQVVGGVVVEGEVGVTGDPEDAGLADLHPREQLVEEGHHDLLEGDEPLTSRAAAAAGRRSGGILTRAKRDVSSVRLRTSTPTLSERLEM